MVSNPRLNKLRIVADDHGTLYSYAKVDLLDQGNGLLIYDYESGEKLSRHSDGTAYSRVPGSTSPPSITTSVPFSQIEHEVVRSVEIRSDATNRLPLYQGGRDHAFVFSSTVLQSRGAFAAEIVDEAHVDVVLEAWRLHPLYRSAQTCLATGTGKAVVLTVLNQRST